MPSFTSLTAALALTSTIIATPVHPEKRQAFSVEQVEGSRYLKNGPEQVIRTLRKYGKPVPEQLIAAAQKVSLSHALALGGNVSGSAPAVPTTQYDLYYLTPVTIAGKTVHLDFDTGSSDLWVFSSLQSSSALAGHDYYTVDPTKEKKGYTWRIGYGDGSGAAGKVYADKVVVGGVTATSQAVEAATAVSSSFAQDEDLDGLLGLAMSSINNVRPQQQKTFFDTVLPQLKKPLFVANLKYHAAGTYDFGYIDKSKYNGSISYINADASKGFWGVRASAYTIGSQTFRANNDFGILDTGTTLMFLDPAVTRAYYRQVTGAVYDQHQGGYVFPCSSTLPDFSVTFGSVKQTVPAKHINYAPAGGSSCYGGLQSNEGLDIIIYGDIFLKGKYVIHEMANPPRIGFAQGV